MKNNSYKLHNTYYHDYDTLIIGNTNKEGGKHYRNTLIDSCTNYIIFCFVESFRGEKKLCSNSIFENSIKVVRLQPTPYSTSNLNFFNKSNQKIQHEICEKLSDLLYLVLICQKKFK